MKRQGLYVYQVCKLAHSLIERAEIHFDALDMLPPDFKARPHDFASYYAIQHDRAELARRICFAAYTRGDICPNG